MQYIPSLTGALLGFALQCILAPLLWAEAASERTAIGSISIDKNTAILIESAPDLSERKLSTIFLTVQGEDPKSIAQIIPISFDADMPTHNHGMMVKASKPKKLDSKDSHTYQVEGVKLHMPGSWRLTVKATIEGKEQEFNLAYRARI